VGRDEPGPKLEPEPEPGAEAADGERERSDVDDEADNGAASKSPLNVRRKRAISERSSSFSLLGKKRQFCDGEKQVNCNEKSTQLSSFCLINCLRSKTKSHRLRLACSVA
jgi:hypothetical protein